MKPLNLQTLFDLISFQNKHLGSPPPRAEVKRSFIAKDGLYEAIRYLKTWKPSKSKTILSGLYFYESPQGPKFDCIFVTEEKVIADKAGRGGT